MSCHAAFPGCLSAVLVCALVSCGAGKTSEAPGGGGMNAQSSGGSESPTAGSGASGAALVTGGSASPSEGGGPTQGGHAGSSGGGGSSSPGGGAGAPTSGGTPGPITCRAKGDSESTITLVNQCADVVSFRGSGIEGGDLAPGEHACRNVGNASDTIPAIRYWGFVGTDPGGEKHTLAELTLNTDFNDFDWYNISHVDAHNLPMQILPVDMADCRVLTCAESLLENCPAEGQLKDENGTLVSCFSPNRDDANSVVAQYFEASCDDAYSWSGDDAESVAACAGEDYDVVFCP